MNITRGNAASLTRVQTVLFVIALGSLAVLAWDLLTGGFRFTLFGIVVSSWDIRRPSALAATSGALALWLRDESAATATWDLIPKWSSQFGAAAAIATTLVAIHFGTSSAGGADSYGYISQAELWTTGHLFVTDPLTSLAPRLGPAVVPLGYRLSSTPGATVPIYPPGLPLAMALARTLAGPDAVFYVVPLLAGVAVWLTFRLAERSFDTRAAIMASVLFAASPLFLFQSFEAMSDVPVTALWLAAWVFAIEPGAWRAGAAGIATAAAILTRPNLSILALVIGAVVVQSSPRLRRAIGFVVPALCAVTAIALFNRALYGSPFESGYGPFDYLFDWHRAPLNVRRYFAWLVELHTPLILIAFATPFVRRGSRVVWMLLFAGTLLSCYLAYFVFDNWTFLRFLLPAIPLFFILASLLIVRGIELLPVSVRTVAFVAICIAGCTWYGLKAVSLGLRSTDRADERYRIIGEYFAQALPTNAVVITVIQSGSVRWYSKRATVRWDLVGDDRLDETIDVLLANGYEPYILLEDYEERVFREHFGTQNVFGRADWPPAIEYLGLPRVRVYAIADRTRRLAGERILTRVIPRG